MSVVVAIKENGVIYMGADSQTTAGKRKHNYLNEMAYKVVKLDNGVLVGLCGRVAARQTILSMKNVFTLDEQGELTKQHIVKEIVPKLVDKMEQIGDEESGSMDVGIMLAYKDKLYRITAGLDVVHLNEIGSDGAGRDFVNYVLFEMKNLSVRERILMALEESAKREESVGGPCVLIDTKELEYEVVDLGGNNH
jgi:ATP-dependent protease HslVU (ClpYQ) peptidase subunit